MDRNDGLAVQVGFTGGWVEDGWDGRVDQWMDGGWVGERMQYNSSNFSLRTRLITNQYSQLVWRACLACAVPLKCEFAGCIARRVVVTSLAVRVPKQFQVSYSTLHVKTMRKPCSAAIGTWLQLKVAQRKPGFRGNQGGVPANC